MGPSKHLLLDGCQVQTTSRSHHEKRRARGGYADQSSQHRLTKPYRFVSTGESRFRSEGVHACRVVRKGTT